MQELLGARHNADVPFPKYEIAAAELGFPSIDWAAELLRLHVGIARRRMTRRLGRKLD
jgi:hypothetical protein